MGVSVLMLFLVTIHGSNAMVDLCKVNVATIRFPLLASIYQNVSVQDPFYLLLCGTYNTADWFSFVCLFSVPLYDCAPTTTTPTTTPSTTSTTTPTSNCATTTTTTPSGSNALVDLCKVTATKLTFPLLASIFQNVSIHDPLYLLICWTYNTADSFSFVCLFQVPLYYCGPAATTLKTTTTCATPGCLTNASCPSDLACDLTISTCTDPCLKKTCATYTICKVVNHAPTCIPGCHTNAGCPTDLACDLTISNCTDPCKSHVCGTNALCTVVSHNPSCECPWGTIGNASVSCIPGCNNDAGCPSDRACDLAISNCTDPCKNHVCGTNAFCKVVSHNPSCECPTGWTGSPTISCSPPGYCSPTTNVTGVGGVIVGDTAMSYNESADYCSACPGCGLFVPNTTSTDMNTLLTGTINKYESYWIGVTFYNGSEGSCILQDINGKLWDYLNPTQSARPCGSDTPYYFFYYSSYYTCSSTDKHHPLCLC